MVLAFSGQLFVVLLSAFRSRVARRARSSGSLSCKMLLWHNASIAFRRALAGCALRRWVRGWNRPETTPRLNFNARFFGGIDPVFRAGEAVGHLKHGTRLDGKRPRAKNGRFIPHAVITRSCGSPRLPHLFWGQPGVYAARFCLGSLPLCGSTCYQHEYHSEEGVKGFVFD